MDLEKRIITLKELQVRLSLKSFANTNLHLCIETR